MSYSSMLTAGKNKATYWKFIRRAETDDNQGGVTVTDAILHRRVLVRVNAMDEKEIAILWDKQAILAQYKVYLEYISGLQEGDQGIDEDTSKVYNIKLIMDWDQDNSMMRLAVSHDK